MPRKKAVIAPEPCPQPCPVLVSFRDNLNSVATALYAKKAAKDAKDDAAFKKADDDVELAGLGLAADLLRLKQKHGAEGADKVEVPDGLMEGLNPDARRLAFFGMALLVDQVNTSLDEK